MCLTKINRYVDVSTGPSPEPSSDPNGFTNTTKTNGFVVNATLPAKQRHTISIQAYGTASQNETTPLVARSLHPFTRDVQYELRRVDRYRYDPFER